MKPNKLSITFIISGPLLTEPHSLILQIHFLAIMLVCPGHISILPNVTHVLRCFKLFNCILSIHASSPVSAQCTKQLFSNTDLESVSVDLLFLKRINFVKIQNLACYKKQNLCCHTPRKPLPSYFTNGQIINISLNKVKFPNWDFTLINTHGICKISMTKRILLVDSVQNSRHFINNTYFSLTFMITCTIICTMERWTSKN